MITLWLLACLKVGGPDCSWQRVQVENNFSCIHAQAVIARYEKQYPLRKVRRWKCQLGERSGDSI